MTTAIIGTGNIGTSVARHLVEGGERVVLAAHEESNATALANELGELASATSVEKAITDADVVVFAVWLDTLKDLIAQHAGRPQREARPSRARPRANALTPIVPVTFPTGSRRDTEVLPDVLPERGRVQRTDLDVGDPPARLDEQGCGH